ncbi:MAG: hypothetical protein ACP5MJ_20375 [Roseiflexus sp.]
MSVGNAVGDATTVGDVETFIAATIGADVAVASRMIVVTATGAAVGITGRSASPATKATATSASAMSDPSAQSAVKTLRGACNVIIASRRSSERLLCSSIGSVSPSSFGGDASRSRGDCNAITEDARLQYPLSGRS